VAWWTARTRCPPHEASSNRVDVISAEACVLRHTRRVLISPVLGAVHPVTAQVTSDAGRATGGGRSLRLVTPLRCMQPWVLRLARSLEASGALPSCASAQEFVDRVLGAMRSPPRAVTLRVTRPAGVSASVDGGNASVDGVNAAVAGLLGVGVSTSRWVWSDQLPVPVPVLIADGAARDAIMRCDEVTSGRLYPHSRSSIAAALALGALPGESVLDIAAAPGGKTAVLAQQMGLQGRLVANDRSPARLQRMRRLLELQGVLEPSPAAGRAFLSLHCGDGARYGRPSQVGAGGTTFDRVLADVPCSGDGALTTADGDDATARWKAATVTGTQKSLLHAALRCCRPGGRVVYSTCSHGVEENELVVSHALKHFAGAVELAPVFEDPTTLAAFDDDVGAFPGVVRIASRDASSVKTLPSDVALCRRVIPLLDTASASRLGAVAGEGFFIAAFHVKRR
jgi:16S rRNA C967 or C1407 C5-methylase (RsmB/RsmF family)